MPKHNLTIEERSYIQIGLDAGHSLRKIAASLQRNVSTISRELRRNTLPEHAYLAPAAQESAIQRRQPCRSKRKFVEGNARFLAVTMLLRKRFSPEQIAATIRAMGEPFQKYYVCHETIYNAVYALPVGELRKELITCLRQGRPKRQPRRGSVDRRGQIPDIVNIALRPPEVEERLLPGHWEGDLIKKARVMPQPLAH